MKIAIINTGSTKNRKGSFNNVHERIKHLSSIKGVQVEAFLIRHYNDWAISLIYKNMEKKSKTEIVDGVLYNNLWVKRKLFDQIAKNIFKTTDLACKSQLNQFVFLFKDFDLLSVHGQLDMILAYQVKNKFNIPFVNNWHGSDINIFPYKNKKLFETTKRLILDADYNFFVSKKLMLASDEIAKSSNKDVLYTGPSSSFRTISYQEKEILKLKNKWKYKYLIGFIGNLIDVKNVMILPDIFKSLNNQLNNIGFIIVGDGKLKYKLKKKIYNFGLSNVTMVGKLEPENIPEVMGCLDILILPSKNEGLPRVSLEALACGVHVIGSDVGGIPESIGLENSFPLDNNFIENVTKRAVELIKNQVSPKLISSDFSWEKSLEKELNIYNKILYG